MIAPASRENRHATSKRVARWRAFAVTAALGATSCTELSARWNDHRVFFGSVREVGSDAILTQFCAETLVERSDVVAFAAPAGTKIKADVVIEGRTEKYFGVAPERGSDFWCTEAAQVYLHPLAHWTCLRVVDDDPPATMLAVERRGEMGQNGLSSGYALELEVRHPGVLRVAFDVPCLMERYAYNSDAGAEVPRGEMTIQSSRP